MKWLAGWTDPGGWPETESKEFAADQYATAREFLAEYLFWLAECASAYAFTWCEYPDDLSPKYKSLACIVLAQTGSFSLTGPDGRVYWVESSDERE